MDQAAEDPRQAADRYFRVRAAALGEENFGPSEVSSLRCPSCACMHLGSSRWLRGAPWFDQLWDSSNYIATHHGECVEAFLGEESPPYSHQVYGLGGVFDFDAWLAENDPEAGDKWPQLSGVTVEGECGIEPPDDGWELPPGELQPCIDSNDNNDDNPFESGHGGGVWGADTFAVAKGSVSLDGPSFFGIDADGAAPLLAVDAASFDYIGCNGETWGMSSAAR